MATSKNYCNLVYQFQTKHTFNHEYSNSSVMSNQYENEWLTLLHANIIRYIHTLVNTTNHSYTICLGTGPQEENPSMLESTILCIRFIINHARFG